MSVSLILRVQAERLPSSMQWQQEVKRHGFALEMDTDFDETVFAGFLPCEYQGIRTGFEYHYGESGAANSTTIEVEFITHSDYREYIASAIAAAVLAEMCDGILEEPQEQTFYAASETVAWAKKVETELPTGFIEPQKSNSLVLDSTPAKPWWKFW